MNDDLKKYPFSKGILTVNTNSFDQFKELIDSDYFKTKNQDFIYRGQGDAAWSTTSYLTRIISEEGSVKYPDVLNYQLNNFKNSVKGRRGVNPEIYSNDIEWWALGQHYELATPMIDFTFSPYVATFFAFEEERRTENRAILALNYKMLCEHYDFDKINECNKIRVYRPIMDDNPRIIAQSGLLVYIPILKDMESIIESCFEKCNNFNVCEPVLIKFSVPDRDRKKALQLLQKMNITNSTIYPDLIGAARFCNMKLRINEY
ncbi:FRG domain-containing protein [uncultured Clostridium sp.]|uniref:FRG domain-containing protein n=1 Tax=uncultured Clostridium sp. TaxID=59620 RepID=UPI0025F5746C|nr:FRG domain-containing protein [uncultured Clostridium sp.]